MESEKESQPQGQEGQATPRSGFLRRGRRAVRRASDVVSGATDTLTGRRLEQAAAEYNELYTPVLLGIHSDVEEQKAQIQELREAVERAISFNQRISEIDAKVDMSRIIAIVAVVLATIGVLGVLWLLLN